MLVRDFLFIAFFVLLMGSLNIFYFEDSWQNFFRVLELESKKFHWIKVFEVSGSFEA